MDSITYHRDDVGTRDAHQKVWSRLQSGLSLKDKYAMANHVAHGARATLTDDGVLLTRRDWPESILLKPFSESQQ